MLAWYSDLVVRTFASHVWGCGLESQAHPDAPSVPQEPLPQLPVAHRLIGISKLSGLCDCAQRWVGIPSKVFDSGKGKTLKTAVILRGSRCRKGALSVMNFI